MSNRYTGDIDGFILGSKARANGPLFLFYTITPIEVIIKGWRAHVESTGTICARFEKDAVEYDLTTICRYISRVEKVKIAERIDWRLVEFVVIFVQDNIVPVAPQPGPYSLKFENLSSRKGFRYSGWLQAQTGTAGVNFGDKLPHGEDVDLLQELNEKSLVWLGGS